MYKRRGMKPLTSEEIQETITALAAEDTKFRSFLGDLLLFQKGRSIPFLFSALDADDDLVRKTSAVLLSKLCRGKLAPEQTAKIVCLLSDLDPKIRKNAAIILGNTSDAAHVEKLRARLTEETVPWVKASVILALGAIGGSEARAAVEGYNPENGEEQQAVEKALAKLAPALAPIPFPTVLPQAQTVEVWVAPGLEKTLQGELQEKVGLASAMAREGVLEVATDQLGRLASVIRTAREILVPIGSASAGRNPDVVSVVSGLLARPSGLKGVFDSYGQPSHGINYRLEVRGNIKHAQRRRVIQQLAAWIGRNSTHFRNNPHGYHMEFRVIVRRTNIQLLWKPYSPPVDRFGYRVADVPASIDPTIAAGIVRLLPKMNEFDRVLDPFCGSGTLLIERAFGGKYEELVGVDISKDAIRAAKTNAAAAGIPVRLIHTDILKATELNPFDLLISNMPFGHRVGSHQHNVELYERFFSQMGSLAKPGAVVALFTQEIELTRKLYQQTPKLTLLHESRIKAGGLQPGLFIGRYEG